MKHFIIAIALIFPLLSNSAPIMDSAIGTPQPNIITIVRDSEDSHLYYIFPQRMGLAENEDGTKRFLYQEYKHDFFTTRAHVTSTFTAQYDKDLVKEKVDEIRAQDAAARFAFVPTITSEIKPAELLHPTIAKTECPVISGIFGQDLACSFIVYGGSLRKLFVKTILNTHTHVFYLNYTFVGHVMGTDKELTHSIPVYTGGLTLKDYFKDSNGLPLFRGGYQPSSRYENYDTAMEYINGAELSHQLGL